MEMMERRERETEDWEGNCAASSFLQAQGLAVARDCRGLPQSLSLPARSFSRAAWYRQKLPFFLLLLWLAGSSLTPAPASLLGTGGADRKIC